MPLLDWLDRCALPEEARLADLGYARTIARRVRGGPARRRHDHRTGVRRALRRRPSTRCSRPPPTPGSGSPAGWSSATGSSATTCITIPQRAYDEGRGSRQAWHGVGRTRYAVIPRFSLSCTDELLDACAALHRDVDGSWFTTHINENPAEIVAVGELFRLRATSRATTGTGSSAGGASRPQRASHARRARRAGRPPARASRTARPATPRWAAGCSRCDRTWRHGVPSRSASDVGAGTGFSLFKEGLQAYFIQQLLGADGVPADPAHLLYLATAAGAAALGLGRPDRRFRARASSSTRCGCARDRGGDPRRRAAARRRGRGRAGQGLRLGHAVRRAAASGSTASRPATSASRPGRRGLTIGLSVMRNSRCYCKPFQCIMLAEGPWPLRPRQAPSSRSPSRRAVAGSRLRDPRDDGRRRRRDRAVPAPAEAELPLATIHRLVRTLVDLGYVRQEPSRQYSLGPRLMRLADVQHQAHRAPGPART